MLTAQPPDKTIDMNQPARAADLAESDETVSQRMPLQANPPRPTFLQRFCQKADQILTEGNFFRIVAAAVVITGACSSHVLTGIIAIIIGGLFWGKCKEMDNIPIFNFSNSFQPSAAGS